MCVCLCVIACPNCSISEKFCARKSHNEISMFRRSHFYISFDQAPSEIPTPLIEETSLERSERSVPYGNEIEKSEAVDWLNDCSRQHCQKNLICILYDFSSKLYWKMFRVWWEKEWANSPVFPFRYRRIVFEAGLVRLSRYFNPCREPLQMKK